jgi:hypothetical protein
VARQSKDPRLVVGRPNSWDFSYVSLDSNDDIHGHMGFFTDYLGVGAL